MHEQPAKAQYSLRCCMSTGFVLTVLTVDGPLSIELPCKLQDDMSIVIENKGVPYADGRGIHHVRSAQSDADAL